MPCVTALYGVIAKAGCPGFRCPGTQRAAAWCSVKGAAKQEQKQRGSSCRTGRTAGVAVIAQSRGGAAGQQVAGEGHLCPALEHTCVCDVYMYGRVEGLWVQRACQGSARAQVCAAGHLPRGERQVAGMACISSLSYHAKERAHQHMAHGGAPMSTWTSSTGQAVCPGGPVCGPGSSQRERESYGGLGNWSVSPRSE
jgi:hypothetical protein